MTDGIKFTLEGAQALSIKMKGLSNDLQYKGGRSALRKAANIIRNTAIENAAQIDDSSTAEEIGKNIVVRWSTKTFKQTGDLAFRIGVLGGARQSSQKYKDIGVFAGKGKANPGGDTFYWRFLEFGTETAPAKPFMRKALSSKVQEVQREFIQQYSKAIDRYLAKAAKSK
jgi:HK97 gp10 family phage protein